MMAAGVPMVQGFEIVAGGQTNPRMKDMLTDIKTNIEGGSSLHESLGKYPVQFDELFVNLVKAGESAGVLDTVLDTVATYKENIEAIKGKIKKAMFYPAMCHRGGDPGRRCDPADFRRAAVRGRCSRTSARTCPRSRRCS